MPLVTLLSDFGSEDWFVGTMKGVIVGIAPTARLIDITHGIPHHDVRAGAFALRASASYFPRGTIHVAVVDPGVGSDRAPIAVYAGGQYFVGPDNGLLSWAVEACGADDIYRIDNPAVTLAARSSTFHGRDIFAPAAAHLATGLPLARLGSRKADMMALPWPEPMACTDGTIKGEVVYIDRFGNAITNLPHEELVGRRGLLALPDGSHVPVCDFYQSMPEGEPLAVHGSTGFLEVAINGGKAADQLHLAAGSPVILS